MVTIREERIADVAARDALLDKAYGAARFAKTSERLREGRCPASRLSLVAVDHCQIIGTVRLWNVETGPGRDALLLGPLAVHLDYRNRGVGTALMRRAIARARLAGHGSILLVGDATYYGRFGFSAALTVTYGCPASTNATGCWHLSLSPVPSPALSDRSALKQRRRRGPILRRLSLSSAANGAHCYSTLLESR